MALQILGNFLEYFLSTGSNGGGSVVKVSVHEERGVVGQAVAALPVDVRHVDIAEETS